MGRFLIEQVTIQRSLKRRERGEHEKGRRERRTKYHVFSHMQILDLLQGCVYI